MRALILIPLLLLSGCAGMASLTESSTLQTLFVFGTMKAIEGSDDPQAKAGRIKALAEDVDAIAATGNIRSELVQRLIDEATAGSALTPADLYLIGQVTPLSAEFAGEDGVIVGERLDALRAFLADIIAATGPYL